jgi:3-methyl-2-oxobutanoate hydroxymethyltransferase
MEGGRAIAEAVEKITGAGIPVMGHLGLTPQSINKFGGFQLRAKQKDEADILVEDAKRLEQAGCFSIVLEKIPALLAQKVTNTLSIPTIGIGGGPHCDGQVLVIHDMLGLNKAFHPKFLRRYADLQTEITEAVKHYIKDVKSKDFPNENEQYD